VNSKITIPIVIGVIIVIIIVIVGVIGITNQEITENKIENKIENKWLKSGPFELDRAQYNVGEKIFLSVKNIPPNDKGTVEFLRPINDTHHTIHIKIPFDGMSKSNFNNYFEPRLFMYRNICTMDDLAGNWIVKFTGTQYEDINFEILNQSSSWDKRTFEPVC